MGFLDSMVGELIRRETGFNAKPMLRKIGGKRLMMMGGAALAGGMLAQQANKQGTFGGSMLGGGGASGNAFGGAPPSGQSLPPTPGHVPSAMPAQTPPTAAPKNLPPLPPPPGGPGTAVAPPDAASPLDAPPMPLSEAEREGGDAPPAELLYVVVRTMISAALADGELSDQERAAIESHLDDSGLTETQQKQIRRDLVIAPAVAELAGMLPDGEDPEILLQFAILVLRADHKLEDLELNWLSRLAVALGVEDDRATALVNELASDLFESNT